jgi:hypothetical protein
MRTKNQFRARNDQISKYRKATGLCSASRGNLNLRQRSITIISLYDAGTSQLKTCLRLFPGRSTLTDWVLYMGWWGNLSIQSRSIKLYQKYWNYEIYLLV